MSPLQSQALQAIAKPVAAVRSKRPAFLAAKRQSPVMRAWSDALANCRFDGSMPMLSIRPLDDYVALIIIDSKHPNATASLVPGELPTIYVDRFEETFRVCYIAAVEPDQDTLGHGVVDDIGSNRLSYLSTFLMGLQIDGHVGAAVQWLDEAWDLDDMLGTPHD